MNSGRRGTPPGHPPKKGGNVNDVRLQRSVISFILCNMDEDEAFAAVSGGKRTRTTLNHVLFKAQAEVLPTVSTRTFRRWFNYFMVYGFTPADAKYEKYRKAPRKKYHHRSLRGRWTCHHTEKLKRIVDQHPDMYLDEIQEAFCAQTGVYWSATYLWKRLHASVGYSLKVIVNKAKQRDEEERKEYQEFMEEFVDSPSQLVYLDETARGRNASRRRRTWFKRGQQPVRDAYFEDDNAKRYTMIAACDINGFIIDTCETIERERGISDKDETLGTVHRERFRLWIENKLLPVLGDVSRMEDRSIVVMDNASIHISDEIEQLIESVGAKVVYLPPYSPDLNPIEMMFGHYKSYLKRYRRDHASWVDTHIHALHSVHARTARNFFRHCNVPKCEEFEEYDQSVLVGFAASAVVAVAAVAAFTP
jgi:transposase